MPGPYPYTGNPGRIANLYLGLLQRYPDESGYQFYVSQLNNNTLTPTQLAATLIASSEYSGSNIPPQSDVPTYVTSLYQRMLRRTPSAAERDFYSTEVAAGNKSVAQVAAEFANSAEAAAVLEARQPLGASGWRTTIPGGPLG